MFLICLFATTDHSFDPRAVDNGGQVAGRVVRCLFQRRHVRVQFSLAVLTLLRENLLPHGETDNFVLSSDPSGASYSCKEDTSAKTFYLQQSSQAYRLF